MKTAEIAAQLKATGISMAEDSAVPMNGVAKKPPYMVVRKEITIIGSDNGRIRMKKTAWTVAYFSRSQDDTAEGLILSALAPVGQVLVTRFPDGTPYQTNFEFTSIEPL